MYKRNRGTKEDGYVWIECRKRGKDIDPWTQLDVQNLTMRIDIENANTQRKMYLLINALEYKYLNRENVKK